MLFIITFIITLKSHGLANTHICKLRSADTGIDTVNITKHTLLVVRPNKSVIQVE